MFNQRLSNATDEDGGGKYNSASKILLVCTHGDTSRMATAMLRARGIEAYCVKGGFPNFVSYFEGEDASIQVVVGELGAGFS